jgi:type IV pilus assembly protein PilC
MSKFTYHGKTKAGEAVHETVEVADRYDVYDVARKAGHEVVSIDEVRGFSFNSALNMEKINAFLSRVKQDEVIMLTRNLSAMLKAGLSLTRALSVGERQTKNPRLKALLVAIREQVNKGDQFNAALSGHKEFSPLYVAMVRAGEEGGTLADALEILATQLHRASELKKKVRGAMIYPAIVIAVMIGIGVLMMIYVVPTLTATFKELNIELPLATKVIIFTSDFLVNHTLLAFGGAFALFATLVAVLKSKPGKRAFAWTITRIPVIGVMAKELNAARTARTLSSLLSSGVDVVGALGITADVVQNPYYRAIITNAAERVQKGNALSEAFIERSDLYPVLVGEMIAVGEETGQISQMLVEVALFYENEVERKTKDLSTIIEPILMVVIGGGVGFFALAMIMPIYSISENI